MSSGRCVGLEPCGAAHCGVLASLLLPAGGSVQSGAVRCNAEASWAIWVVKVSSCETAALEQALILDPSEAPAVGLALSYGSPTAGPFRSFMRGPGRGKKKEKKEKKGKKKRVREKEKKKGQGVAHSRHIYFSSFNRGFYPKPLAGLSNVIRADFSLGRLRAGISRESVRLFTGTGLGHIKSLTWMLNAQFERTLYPHTQG